MGMRIGDMGGSITFLRSSPRGGAAAAPRPESQAVPASRDREETEIARAGFGAGTVSVPTAAVRALGTNLDNARQIVPTVEQSRAELRERLAQERALKEAETTEQAQEPPEPINVSFQRNEAAARAQARQFINRLNEAAGTAQARFAGREPEGSVGGPRIRVGEEAFAFQTAPEGPTQVDLLA
jgi:hypothetical protein